MLALRTAVRKVERLAYSPDGSRLAVGGPTGTEVLEVASNERVALLAWLTLGMVAFRSDNNSLLIAYGRQMMTIINLSNSLENPFSGWSGGPRNQRITHALMPVTDEWLVCHFEELTRMKFVPASDAHPSSQATVWVSGAPNANTIRSGRLTTFGTPLRVAIFCSNFAQANEHNKYLYLLDGDTGELIRRHRCGYGSVEHFTGSPCGGYLVGVMQSTLIVWDTAALHLPPQRWANDSRKQFTGVAFHPHGRYLLTASNDKSVKLWDLTCGQVVRSYDWAAGRMRSVAVAPDGLTAAAGSDENLVVLFDLDL